MPHEEDRPPREVHSTAGEYVVRIDDDRSVPPEADLAATAIFHALARTSAVDRM